MVDPDYSNFYGVPTDNQAIRDKLPGRYPWLFETLPSLRLYSLWRFKQFLPTRWSGQIITIDKSYDSVSSTEECYRNFHTRYVKGNIRAFIAICRLHGVLPVLMTNNYHAPDMVSSAQKYYAYGFDAVNEEIKRIAAEEEVLLLDMAEEFSKEPGMMMNKFEFTYEGNIDRVRIMTEFLERHNLLSGSMESSGLRA